MMRGILVVIILMITTCGVPFCAAAQSNKNNPIDTVYNYVPEFYANDYQKVRDTIFRYEAYDSRDSVVKYIDDYDKVRYYSLLKEYIDSFHTYKDKKGLKQFLPVSVIVKRYDRLGKNKWMCIEYPGNKYTEFKDDRSDIVLTKIILIDRNDDNVADIAKVMYYYKLVPVIR